MTKPAERAGSGQPLLPPRSDPDQFETHRFVHPDHRVVLDRVPGEYASRRWRALGECSGIGDLEQHSEPVTPMLCGDDRVELIGNRWLAARQTQFAKADQSSARHLDSAGDEEVAVHVCDVALPVA